MKQKLYGIIMLLTLMFTPAAALSGTAYAAPCGPSDTSKGQVLKGVNQTGGHCSDGSGIYDTVAAIVQILSFVVGIAAIIMIIISGFKYIVSGGDSAKVGSAKNTLIYALIGLIVAALAQVLVHFVLNRVFNAVE